jgi:hypothetical protein
MKRAIDLSYVREEGLNRGAVVIAQQMSSMYHRSLFSDPSDDDLPSALQGRSHHSYYIR